MMKGGVTISKGKVSQGKKMKQSISVVNEEMVGQGKKQVSNLMLKFETPKKYISFK